MISYPSAKGGNMKENIISDIETMARDYDNVEKMIAQCAHLAVDAIKAKLYKSRTVANSAQANYTAIYNCFNCYKNSGYTLLQYNRQPSAEAH